MDLEQYRKKVTRRLALIRILALVFLLMMLLAPRFMDDGALKGFISGAGAGGLLVAATVMTQQTKALKDDKLLRRLYIEEHDERKIAIRVRAGYPMVAFLSLALVIAATVAECLKASAVSVTLMIVALAQLMICLIVKFVCMKRM